MLVYAAIAYALIGIAYRLAAVSWHEASAIRSGETPSERARIRRRLEELRHDSKVERGMFYMFGALLGVPTAIAYTVSMLGYAIAYPFESLYYWLRDLTPYLRYVELWSWASKGEEDNGTD
jgi:hypothetical protein